MNKENTISGKIIYVLWEKFHISREYFIFFLFREAGSPVPNAIFVRKYVGFYLLKHKYKTSI